MTNEKIKRMFDACYQAKRIREMLPPLPPGVMPSYIQYLDVIRKLEGQGTGVKVSDISDALNIPRPGVTRTVKEMEKGGYLRKDSSDTDGRITYLTITDEGRMLSRTYNEQFFAQLTPLLAEISDGDADCTIHTIEKLYQIMSERKISLEYR